MKTLADGLQAVVFDYGNTLIEFGPDQVRTCDEALSRALADLYGPHDFDRLHAIQHEERRAPYSGEFIENDLATATRSLIRRLFDRDADDDHITHLLEIRFQAMTSCVRVQDEVFELLDALRSRFRLGLISNYPCGRSIRHSLAEHGLNRFFDVVVVSGELGRVKPHPLLFETALRELNVDPQAAMYVGDNWLGDIQGARNYGMKAAWIRQYVPYEDFPREQHHHEPHAVIDHLRELRRLL